MSATICASEVPHVGAVEPDPFLSFSNSPRNFPQTQDYWPRERRSSLDAIIAVRALLAAGSWGFPLVRRGTKRGNASETKKRSSG